MNDLVELHDQISYGIGAFERFWKKIRNVDVNLEKVCISWVLFDLTTWVSTIPCSILPEGLVFIYIHHPTTTHFYVYDWPPPYPLCAYHLWNKYTGCRHIYFELAVSIPHAMEWSSSLHPSRNAQYTSLHSLPVYVVWCHVLLPWCLLEEHKPVIISGYGLQMFDSINKSIF